MLHACQHFMSRLVTFSNESAVKVRQAVAEVVPPQHAPIEPFLSSRLLNRQCKYAMHKLHRELTREVLEGLQRSMKQRTKDTWGVSFCTILLLCLCMEDLQIAADTFVVYDMERMEREGSQSIYSREQSLLVCQNLDGHPFQQAKRLFHDIYRTHREAGSARDGLNPFRSLQLGEETDLGAETDALVREMTWLLNAHRKYLSMLTKEES